jgi:hypothetical protein
MLTRSFTHHTSKINMTTSLKCIIIPTKPTNGAPGPCTDTQAIHYALLNYLDRTCQLTLLIWGVFVECTHGLRVHCTDVAPGTLVVCTDTRMDGKLWSTRTWPYAKMQTLKPSTALCIKCLVSSNTLPWLRQGSNTYIHHGGWHGASVYMLE